MTDSFYINNNLPTSELRYPRKLSYHPQLFSNDDHKIKLANSVRNIIPYYDDAGNQIAKGLLEIEGTWQLRPYDESVYGALLKLLSNHGTFDEVDFEMYKEMSDSELNNHIPEFRTLECTLDDIAHELSISGHNNNRQALHFSVKSLRAITISTLVYPPNAEDDDIYSGNSKVLGTSLVHGLISNATFDPQNLDAPGIVRFDDFVIGEILRGNYTIVDFELLKKFPKGASRKFARFVSAHFKPRSNESIEVIKSEIFEPYERFLKQVLGLNYSNHRRRDFEFKKIAKLLEKRSLIEYGWSLPKKSRTYELLVEKDGEILINLKRGEYFDNPDAVLSTTDTIKKTDLEDRLGLYGFTEPWVDLFVRSCTKQPLDESISEHKGKVLYFVDASRGLAVQKDGEIHYPPLDWERLENYCDFVDLFFEYHDQRSKYSSKAGVLRKIIFEKKFYSLGEVVRLKELKTKALEEKKLAKTSEDKERLAQKEKETAQKIENERADADRQIQKTFLKLCESFKFRLEKQMLLTAHIQAIVGEKDYKTWFVTFNYVEKGGEVYAVSIDSLAVNMVNKLFARKITVNLEQETELKRIEFIGRDEFIGRFSESSDDMRHATQVTDVEKEQKDYLYSELHSLLLAHPDKQENIIFMITMSILSNKQVALESEDKETFSKFLLDDSSVSVENGSRFLGYIIRCEEDIRKLLTSSGFMEA